MKKQKAVEKSQPLGKFQVELGKEEVVQYHEFKDSTMNDETATMLKNYAMEHILSDNDALINYAFNRILIEQVKKEQEKNVMIYKMLRGELSLQEDDEVTVRRFNSLLNDLLDKESNTVKESISSVMKKAKRPKKVKEPELF